MGGRQNCKDPMMQNREVELTNILNYTYFLGHPLFSYSVGFSFLKMHYNQIKIGDFPLNH